MEGRRGANRWMQTMLLMLAIVSSLAVVLLWEPSPLAPNSSHGVVLMSPILSFSGMSVLRNNCTCFVVVLVITEPGRDLENLAKSDDSQPSQPIFPSFEGTQGTDPIGRETAADRQSFTDTVGTWVLDKTRPLYSGRECTLWLSPDWACRLHNHPDKQMDRYRWQPAGCNLPVFNASAALEMLRNKVVAFAGDSLGRQQWQSLLCMLTHGKNHTSISDAASMFHFYTPHGARRPTGWAHHFDATNTTIVFKWTVTLARVEALNESTNALHLDRPEQFLSDYLPTLDVVILNSGHHWNDDKVQENGYRFYSKGKPLTDTSVPVAYNQTIHNIVRWFHDQTRNSGKVIYYRSLSPRHFRNGDWNTGGTCDTIRFEEDRQAQEEGTTAVDTNADSAVKGTNVRLLNITALSMERGETHVSKYGRYEGGQDCMHWCLPGVPDTWNEILLAELAAAATATTTTSPSRMNS